MKTIHILFISILLGSLSGCKSDKGSSEPGNPMIISKISIPQVTDLKVTHPRLLLSDDQLLNLKQKINADTMLSEWYDKVKGDAEEIMSLPLSRK